MRNRLFERKVMIREKGRTSKHLRLSSGWTRMSLHFPVIIFMEIAEVLSPVKSFSQ